MGLVHLLDLELLVTPVHQLDQEARQALESPVVPLGLVHHTLPHVGRAAHDRDIDAVLQQRSLERDQDALKRRGGRLVMSGMKDQMQVQPHRASGRDSVPETRGFERTERNAG